MHTVNWIIHSPSPYNDALFRALGESPDIDLVVHFWHGGTSKHFWKNKMAQGFASRAFSRTLGVDTHVLSRAKKGSGLWIFGGWTEPTVHLAALRLAMGRTPYAVWTDRPQPERKRSAVKTVVREAVLSTFLGNATYVMGTGKPALDVLRTMGARDDKLVNFPYYIDTEAFCPGPRQNAPSGDRLVFLSSGRLNIAHKGLDLAIRALALLAEKRPHVDFVWRVAGLGPDEAELKALAETLGIADRVEWLGWVEAADLPQFYRTGDVFLFPSRVEPYGVAAIEAMSTGLAVVGADTACAVVDRIRSGENGLSHCGDDHLTLGDCLIRLADDRDALRSMGRVARQTALQWPLSRAVNTVKRMAEGTPAVELY